MLCTHLKVVTKMKTLSIALALTLSLTQAHASVFKKIKQAKTAYKTWKQENPDAAETFKARHKAMKKALKDPNSELHLAVKMTKEICTQNESDCESAMTTFVKPLFEASMATTVRTNPVLAGYVPDQDRPGFHAILFGTQTIDGDSNDSATSAIFQTYGPGLWVGLSSALIACANDQDGVNYGLMAGVSALFGVQAGLYFGENGICSVLAVNIGAGAYFGFSILEF